MKAVQDEVIAHTPRAKPLSAGAQLALMRLALLNTMDPKTDGYAWCGPFGRVLVERGYAIAKGRDEMGFKCFRPTAAGKAEGLRLYRATAPRAAAHT